MNILATNLSFPEGPAFDNLGTIWLVEKEAGNLISIDNQTVLRHKTNGHPNGIAIDKNNIIWFCDSLQNSIRTYNPRNKEIKTISSSINGEELKMPNDLAFDKWNNLIFTCPGNTLTDKTGYICCLKPNHEILIIKPNMQYPNGLAFSKDYKHLFVAETGTHALWKFDWDPNTLTLSNDQLWATTGGPIGPDGIALDQDENVYVAVYGSSTVKKINSSGKIIEIIQLNGTNPTNCAIDPQGTQGLIITEAEHGTLLQIPINANGIL